MRKIKRGFTLIEIIIVIIIVGVLAAVGLGATDSSATLYAYRCTSGGKTPQGVDYRLAWGINSNGLLSQYAYYTSAGGGWIYTSDWGGCCR